MARCSGSDSDGMGAVNHGASSSAGSWVAESAGAVKVGVADRSLSAQSSVLSSRTASAATSSTAPAPAASCSAT